MNPVVHALRFMGGRATTFLPLLLAIGLLFQNVAAAARPFLWPLAVALLILALARTHWSRLSTLLRPPVLAIVLALANLIAGPPIALPLWPARGPWARPPAP